MAASLADPGLPAVPHAVLEHPAAGGRLTAAAGGRFVVVGERYRDGESYPHAGTGSAPGSPLELRPLDSREGGGVAAIDDDRRGGGAIVYAPLGASAASGRVKLARRGRSGTRFGAGVPVSRRGRVGAVAVRINALGHALVAWERDGRVEARIARGRGRRGRVVLLARARTVRQLSAGLSDTGAAVVAWVDRKTAPRPDGGDGVRVRASAGTVRRGFGPARELDSFGDNDHGFNGAGVRAVVAGRRAIVAWSGRTATAVAFAPASGSDRHAGSSRARTATTAAVASTTWS